MSMCGRIDMAETPADYQLSKNDWLTELVWSNISKYKIDWQVILHRYLQSGKHLNK